MDLHLTAPFTIDTWDAVPDPETAEPGAAATARAVLVKGGHLPGDLDPIPEPTADSRRQP